MLVHVFLPFQAVKLQICLELYICLRKGKTPPSRMIPQDLAHTSDNNSIICYIGEVENMRTEKKNGG